MKWVLRQKKTIVATADDNDDCRVGYDEAFDEFLTEDSIADMNKIIANLCTYFISFTSGDANRVVRNAGEGQALEAWHRLNNEHDPTSSMRR
eukprot:9778037-Heterocapsa_arctica.AAC.1